MSSSAFVLQHGIPAGAALRLLAAFILGAGVLFLFRPLLTGIFRAALLLVRPRLSLEQRIARAKLRDRRLMQTMIAASSGPSHAAELRAMGARD
ncbi:hypothetical protein [Massilia sp. CF038]|uniref:hypothetical protein n=1 Tax=Massilia sp. CF038 TaxID=1881045 RepID=UPI000923760A|nr:hypothetical protein [Massilia sp. CF038]SHH44796.1 hypothetical protein SAMN05428948_4076 [Massilia sp. CF038]